MIQVRTALITTMVISSFSLVACNKSDVTNMPAMTEKPVSTSTTSTSSPIQMTAQLSGATEVPPNKSPGKGMVDASFDKASNVLTWTITYSDLTGPATAAHFHGPAAPGENAPPALPLTGGLDSPIKGTATLTSTQASDLTAGKWYINVHTAANPEGEIRGQMGPKP